MRSPSGNRGWRPTGIGPGGTRATACTWSASCINPWVVHDVQIGRRFALFEGLRVGIGIDNVLDEQAPFAASAFNDNHDGRTHDLRGRYWYAKLTQDF